MADPLIYQAGRPHDGGVKNDLSLLWETFFELLTIWPTPSILDGVGHVYVTKNQGRGQTGRW